MPSVLAYPLFYKLVAPEASLVNKTAMQAWVLDKQLVSLDVQSRMMEVRFGANNRTPSYLHQRVQLHSVGRDPSCLRCRVASQGLLTVATLLKCTFWSCVHCEPRLMQVLCKDGATSVTQADLKSMMAGILLSHPGLEFLQDTPEFQDR